MSTTFSDFTSVALSGSDTLVGYRVATSGGEIRSTVSGLASTLFASPTITNPTLSGYTQTAAEVISYTAMSALQVNVGRPGNTKSITGDATFTFSNNTPSAGTRTRVKITADSFERIVTIPSCWSTNRNSTITSIKVPANGTLTLLFEYTGTRWEVYGDPVITAGTGPFELGNNSRVLSFGLGDVNGSTAVAVNSLTAYTVVPWNCHCSGGNWSLQANGSGPTGAMDILRIPVGTSLPTGSFIGTGAKPNLLTGNAMTGTTTDWTNKIFTAGDLVCSKVTNTNGVATWMGLQLTLTRT